MCTNSLKGESIHFVFCIPKHFPDELKNFQETEKLHLHILTLRTLKNICDVRNNFQTQIPRILKYLTFIAALKNK